MQNPSNLCLEDEVLDCDPATCTADPASRHFLTDPALLWCGDFNDGGLLQYSHVQCGGEDDVCPRAAGQGEYETTLALNPTDHCAAGADCRFLVERDTATDANELLRLLVGSADLGQGGDQWGEAGVRNELLISKETDPVSGRLEDKRFVEGDERYYYWKTKFPDAALFPDPFQFDSHADNRSWHVFLQFHHVGSCASPPVSVVLNRTMNKGGEYRIGLNSKQEYSDTSPDETLAFEPGSQPIARGGWYEFLLHVAWNRKACGETGSPCDPAHPDGGMVELWARRPSNPWKYWGAFGRKTIFEWDDAYCPADVTVRANGNYDPSVPQPVELKFGLYRDVKTNAHYDQANEVVVADLAFKETIFQADLRVGTTCQSVMRNHFCPERPH